MESLRHDSISASAPKANILLVDDNPANLLALRAVLEGLDQNLHEARSGEEALRQIQNAEFAVVLLDVQMPGKNGFETARLIRAQKRSDHTPIIFLTAYDSAEFSVEQAYSLGVVDYLVKPFSSVVLGSKVAGFVSLYQEKEQAKREAEQLRLLIQGTTEYAIFLLDPDGYVASWNSGAERIKQYRAEEIIGQHFSRFYAQDAIDRGWPAYELQMATKVGRFEDEGWRIRKDGTPFWANVVITALYDEAGNPRGFSKITRDMTERKQAEENARSLLQEEAARRVAEENAKVIEEQRERLRLALEAGDMGTWDWNFRTDEINWSDSFRSLYGLGPDGFRGTLDAVRQRIHPEDRELVTSAIRLAIEHRSEYDIEYRNVWPNGSVHWIAEKGQVFAGSDEAAERMIGIGMDITQRKRSEHAARFLADASATLASLVDFSSTLQKVVSLAVPSFADWAAVDLAESDGSLRRVAVAHADRAKIELAHDVYRRFPPDPSASAGVWNILRTGQSEIVPEITDDLLAQSVPDKDLLGILRALGLRSYIGVPLNVRGRTLGVLTFIAAESGHLFDDGDLAVAHELADRAAVAIENTQLYQELREADRRKDEFLATLAHELRNPLAPIRNSLQILKMPRLDAATFQQTNEMMERQVHHLVRLVDDLMDVSRVMRGKIELRKETVELASIVARAVETVQPHFVAQEHELQLSLPAESLLLDVDPVRLAQVIGNLLTNAAKYTEPRGRIWLSAEREADVAVLRIRDNGLGIAADMLPHVFELFVQADHGSARAQGGLGIGLTLVKNLVEMHQGTVAVRSSGLGQGSEFTVRLPLAANVMERPNENVDNNRGQSRAPAGHRLLVVDDNKDAGTTLAMLLRLQGHEVRVVHDGLTALKTAQEFRPALILLDIGMPGMDGYEVARRIRQQTGLDRVVLAALTGWGQPEDRRRSAEAGFDHHLVKPPNPNDLQAILTGLNDREPSRSATK